jgi:hypothetical protein
MAFDRKLLSGNVGAGSSAPMLFMYGGVADTIATVIASGYFNGAAAILSVGDIIVSTTTTTPVMLYVATNDGTTVTTGYVAVA